MAKYKKWVMCLGYSGRGYFGMQRQIRNEKIIDDLPTIENELLKSFWKAELITENEYNTPSLLRFQRAARTDKNVSALRQIISLNLPMNADSYLKKINENLPKKIRVFGLKKATKYFDCKNFCDARTYCYLLPSFSICKISDTSIDSFRCSKELIQDFNDILSLYIGTKNFHNFTAHKNPTDPSARRYITRFECSQPFYLKHLDKELEFINIRVRGQSFMLHQIRKMIGLAIAIMNGFTDRNSLERAFSSERIDVPIAPGLGLYLEDIHFDRYNKKYGGDGIHQPILWDEYNDEIATFKSNFIYTEIAATEIQESSMLNWIQTLSFHTYGQRDHQPLNEQKSACSEDESCYIKEQLEAKQKNVLNGNHSEQTVDEDDDDERIEVKKIKLNHS
ncbi:BCL-6 corepressor [Sarcoptes scabiei]|nr:BCL-6 corepressor [Sarcoptes scabiei]